jgi:hypothetical protein
MKLDQRKISLTLVLVYIICVFFTAYILFTIQDDLIYGQALDLSQLSMAKPILMKLYFTTGLTILFGLGILYYFFNTNNMEVIYVEKKEEKKKNTEKTEDGNDKKLDVSSIKDALSSRSKSEEKILSDGLTELCKRLEAGVGAFYMVKKDKDKKVLQMNATYAMSLSESQRPIFEFGEGLVGQVAQEEKPINIDDIPEGYIKVISGLGSASPTHVLIIPIKYGKELFGVAEIASFTAFNNKHIDAVNETFEIITNKLYAKSGTKEEVASSEKSSTKKVTKKS